MRQSVVRAVIAVAILSGAPAHGAISPGSASGTTPPGELFFTVWDATNQVTYTRDLGISIVDFLGSANTRITRAPDALYTSTFSGVDPSTLRYSVGAFNARFDDFPAAYGMVITSNSAAELVKVTDFTALFSTLQVAESYIVGANGKDGGNPTDYLVSARDIRTVVEELWLAGAEAVAVNGERVTTATAIIDIGGSVLLNAAYLSPPYQVSAIGPSDLFDQVNGSASFRDFIRMRIEAFGLQVGFAEPKDVVIPAYAGTINFRYSRPITPAPSAGP